MNEFIIFDFAILCLIYSENIGISISLYGFITLISGDCFVNYSFLSQTSSLLIYGELLWLLGLIFILFGTVTILSNKNYVITNWFSRTNTIKNELAFWSFGTSILSFLLFFTIAYFFSAINKQLLLGLPLFVMMYSVIVVISSIIMGKRFEAPFKKLTDNVEALLAQNRKNDIDDNFTTQEFIFLQRFIVDAFEIKEQKERVQQAMINLTTQVAHDIRSPLAAINTVVSDVASIPENKRIMIRNAAKRINDIANNLLLQTKDNFSDLHDCNTDNNSFPELLFVVLDNIVSEKRYEYYKSNVSIVLKGSDCSYNCFSNINLGSFKRVLSNLINNSIEAVNSQGSVVISLTCNDTAVEIIIEDNGCGIPPDILPKITEQGFSFNKKNGAGFGLSYAKQYLELIDGKMHIHSEKNIGTKIIISLNRCLPPSWFCDSLNIQKGFKIVVLDDDLSIHEAWDQRFSHISFVKIIHFYNVSELLQYEFELCKQVLYLVDYELLGDAKNGLDVIEELKLNDNAILVTSSFEDITIRTRCENIGVKIIPKSYVPYIEINLLPSIENQSSMVFIDNDEMMRTTWAFAANNSAKNIALYSSLDEFLSVINDYGKDTIIYIDSDLGNNIKGEIESKKLFELGFTEIYLATGYSPREFGEIPWIKAIVGKSPPF
ncbi:hybrid sensor histidine kinase/response regulator (plasmid) [Legionella lytica]|uniref:histidine kinase n=1 Tax=Legionella lytica TaxID=96232 RepID=A0ABY4YDK6_9GAMM|nr:HAMP domain-containing sensor histidine kinase [Legionella lytica]USQ15559.1 hybrid sensor histidine kinase/response regulator [Legionella lytica]